MGMPGPTPIPLFGEAIKFVRKVSILSSPCICSAQLLPGSIFKRCGYGSKIWQSHRVSEPLFADTRYTWHTLIHFIPHIFPYEDDWILYRVFEGTAPIILVTDPDLLRKVLIKDSHLFINRRVRWTVLFTFTSFFADHRSRSGSFRAWSHRTQRRSVEKCPQHCIAHVFFGQTQSGIVITGLSSSNSLSLRRCSPWWIKWAISIEIVY
jgi:hypothetical protein